MMRTVEIFLVIMIITTAFLISSFYAVLPQPRQVSPINLRRLALTALQTLDENHKLSEAVFKPTDDPAWSELQVALSACLPPNMVFNLTVYEVLTGEAELYNRIESISNAESLGVSSDASSLLVASSNVTFNVIPEKIGQHGGGGTLYILNCSDANGWWITGYTAHSLAQDLYKMLSPYFQSTIMVQSTTQFGQILNGSALQGEVLQKAVVINTCGETVPIPRGYAQRYYHNNYAEYCYQLGRRVNQYNWTWISIVGYPLYYVSNTGYFTGSSDHNGYGIYGMRAVGPAGFNAFLRGLDNQAYVFDDDWITESLTQLVRLSSESLYYCNYYGIYPSPYHTASRALPSWILNTYHLTVSSYVFNQVGNWIPGAFYRHTVSGRIDGSFLALGLTRSPDIRLTALGLLCHFKPRLYRSEYVAYGTSRLVVLQIGLVGGV